MKKYLSYVLGLIGAGLAGYGFTKSWTSLYLPIADRTMVKTGMDAETGILPKIAIALVGIALVLLFVRPKLAVIVGALGLLFVMAFFFVMEGKYSPGSGIWLTAGGAALVTLGGLLRQMRRRR